jgi:hypothetical protein
MLTDISLSILLGQVLVYRLRIPQRSPILFASVSQIHHFYLIHCNSFTCSPPLTPYLIFPSRNWRNSRHPRALLYVFTKGWVATTSLHYQWKGRRLMKCSFSKIHIPFTSHVYWPPPRPWWTMEILPVWIWEQVYTHRPVAVSLEGKGTSFTLEVCLYVSQALVVLKRFKLSTKCLSSVRIRAMFVRIRNATHSQPRKFDCIKPAANMAFEQSNSVQLMQQSLPTRSRQHRYHEYRCE